MPRPWIWFFASLVVLAAVAIVVPLLYNRSIQLTAVHIEDARGRWQANGPADYDLVVRIHTQPGDQREEYVVKVRDRRVVGATRNDRPVSPRGYDAVAVEGLFDRLERERTEATGRDFLTATFDPSDGHLTRFVRRRASTRERVEILVRFELVSGVPPRVARPCRTPVSTVSYRPPSSDRTVSPVG